MNEKNKNVALALKKMRQLKNLSRHEASIIQGISAKTIEKYENARANLTSKIIEQMVLNYEFNIKDFHHCLEGRSFLVQEKNHKPKKIINNKKLRRSYQKLITKETKALKSLRYVKGLSQYKASALCGYNRGAIGHIENGRVELPQTRISHIVKSYGFTMEDFNRHLNLDTPYSEIQIDCIQIIKSLSEEKLKAVHPLLSTFKN